MSDAATPDAARAAAAYRRRLVLGVAGVWLVAPAALAAARYPRWWAWIAPEQTPMTWLQSVVLVLAAAISLLAGVLLALQAGPRRDRRAWSILSLGLVLLALDERFAVHERVRDGVLAPRDVRVPFLPWVGAGDFLLLAVALVGLGLLPVVWPAVAADRGAARAFVLGVAVAVVAVGMDSVDPAAWSVAAERVEQTAEEVVELGSGLCLLAAAGLRLLGLLAGLAGRPPDSPAASTASTASVHDQPR